MEMEMQLPLRQPVPQEHVRDGIAAIGVVYEFLVQKHPEALPYGTESAEPMADPNSMAVGVVTDIACVDPIC